LKTRISEGSIKNPVAARAALSDEFPYLAGVIWKKIYLDAELDRNTLSFFAIDKIVNISRHLLDKTV
jgi:hypothetical protein